MAANSRPAECEKAMDEILAARCEERPLESATERHVETCAPCRDATNQLASASPEALAVLVLMRGISP